MIKETDPRFLGTEANHASFPVQGRNLGTRLAMVSLIPSPGEEPGNEASNG